jgi:spermidine/putrescine transport system ATP-binding protein
VFQSYALFPHLDVFDNVAFGLRMRRLPRGQIKEKVERMLALMQISDLRTRRPLELSGGEKQRVALARAVVNEPDILLLDEPLGALDLKLRQQLQIELHRWQRELGMTFLYVTHDQDEALTLSDRIAVLNAGRIEQVGTGEDLYERPASRFVAQFLGRCNLLDATVSGHEPGGGAMLTTLCGRITGPTASTPGPVMLAIRPEKILLDPPGEHRNELKGVVREVVYNGAETHYTVQAGQADLRVTILNAGTAASPRFVAGQSVRLVLPVDALRVLAH